MDHFAGLDVSVKETSICIVDDTGRIMKEVKVASKGPAEGSGEPRLPLQADRTGSWAAIAMAIQWACGSRLPKDCSASPSNPMMEGPWCRFRREARARERHRHCSGG